MKITNAQEHDAAIDRLEYLIDRLEYLDESAGDPKVISEIEILSDAIMLYEFLIYPDMRRKALDKRGDS